MDDYNKRQPYDVEGPDYVRPRIMNGEDDAVNIVYDAQHSVDRMIKDYHKARDHSIKRPDVNYRKKRRTLRNRFVSLALCSIALATAYMLIKESKKSVTVDPSPTMNTSYGDTLTEENNTDVTIILHTVKATDTLSSLAERYNTTIEEIMENNDIDNPNFIYIDQVLRIPAHIEKNESNGNRR